MTFHQKLKAERMERNLSQEEFAKMLNVSRQSVSKWERDLAYPNVEMLIEISDIFEMSLDELLKSDKALTEKIIKDSKKLKYPRLKMFFDLIYTVGWLLLIVSLPLMLFISLSALIFASNGLIFILTGWIGRFFVKDKFLE